MSNDKLNQLLEIAKRVQMTSQAPKLVDVVEQASSPVVAVASEAQKVPDG